MIIANACIASLNDMNVHCDIINIILTLSYDLSLYKLYYYYIHR